MKKILSLIITICFIVSSFNNMLFALTSYNINPNITNTFEETLLPKNLGSITYSNIKNTNNIVINIQDLHANSQVQKNINSILNYLANNNDIKSIYLEGASDKVDISWLKNLDSKDKTEISNTLLDIGMLTGTEFFSINDTHSIPLYGLEDKIVHQDNIKHLSLIINDSAFIKEKLLSIKKDLNILNNRFVNSKNKKFAKIINKHQSKEISTLEFYSVLIKYIDNISANSDKYNNLINLSKEDYPNILLLKDLLFTESKIDKNNLYKEFKIILAEIKGTLSVEQYRNFLSATANTTNINELTDFIKQFATNNNLDLSQKYPNIKLLIQCKTATENINFTKILKEEELIINNIKTALSYNSNEYEIIFLNDFYTYLEKALTNNLTAKDYDYFISSVDKFEMLYPKYVVYNQLKDIDKYIETSKQFYKTNNERNNIFIEQIKKDIKAKDKSIIILVTGGYHTEGLKDLLSKQNISFITITPQVIGLTNNSNLYNNIIVQESKEYSKNTMAFTIASQMQDITFAKTLIAAGLQHKVPFQQIKQIAKKVFNNRVIDEDDNSFTLAIGIEPVTITQQNGYAVLDLDIKADESLAKDLSVFAQDIDSTDGKLSIKLLLNLLNIMNHYQSFDNFALTQENDILKAIINTLVFMVEELNIQFSNGFEQKYIEKYVNDEIINNTSEYDKALDGVDINTARFLPKVIQSILYENDKAKKQIDIRKQQFYEGVDTSDETEYLGTHHKSSLQISGLLASMMKDVFSFIESDEKISPELKAFFYNLADISDIANYITIAVFNLADNVKGISLAQGLIGLTTSIKYPMLIECMGHEFAHEMLLRLKDYTDPNNNSILNKLFSHEAHSYLFSVLFAQIFNNLLLASFSDTEYRDYNKFLIDLDDLYSSSIRRNLTDKTKSMAQAKEIHIPVLNFINMLNRCLGKDGNLMSVQDLMTLTETVREVFLMDNYAEMPYPTILYTILIEFAKKVNPNSKAVLDKYSNQIIIATKLFTIDEPDGKSLLIETFANVLLTGTAQQIETFVNDKIIASQRNIQQYIDVIKKLYSPATLKLSPELYDIVDEIIFTILGNRILSLKNTILSRETKILVGTIIAEIRNFNSYCDTSSIKDKKTAFEKLLKTLKEQDNIESLSEDEISALFIKAFSSIYAETSNSRFSIYQVDSTDMYKIINEVLPTILQKHNKVINLEQIINLIITPNRYQSIDITKEILKIKNIDLEETLEILTELFVTLVKDYNLSFNNDIIKPQIKDYAKDKQAIAGFPIDTFSKLPAFMQEILYNAETATITKNQNEFTRDHFISNKNKTNALLKLVLQDIYTLLKYQGYTDLLSIPDTSNLTIFAGYIASGVSNGNFIAINPKDESFLNVIAHELGHILLTNAGFSHYNSTTIHELFAYTLGLLSTTIYNDSDIETEKFLPVTYENITDSDEHSLPKTLLQLIIDVKGSPLTETQLLSILEACKIILKENVSKETNIELAYRILELLEQDETFMQGFMPNALTIKLETIIDEPQERKDKILQQLFNVSVPRNILIVDKETFIRNQEESPIFIDRKILNEIFDKNGNIIEGKEQEFEYLTELVRLQVIQQYDLTKQQRVEDFEKIYACFKDLETMLKQPFFNKYFVTFKREVNRMSLDNKELIYISPEYLKKIDSSKYSEYLTSLIILRSLENKFNTEFNTNAKFDFYVSIDNLDNIPIDLQKFLSPMNNNYEYLKQEYTKHNEKQQKIEQAIEKILDKNKIKDKKLFADKIRNLMFLVENPNIEFMSIDFFKELSANTNHLTMQQVYNNLIEVYSYLITNNLLSFNSSFSNEIENYIKISNADNLDGIEIDTVIQMPSFIQNMLYKNMILEEDFKLSPVFVKQAKYKSDRLNGLLNIIAEDITNIVTTIYPELDKNVLSAQLFFSSLQRLTDGVNYGNNKIAISNKHIKRYSYSPNALIMEILKTISHELGHEELILKGISESSNNIDTLHELYAYLVETLLIKSYSQAKGIKETTYTVFAANENLGFIGRIIDDIFILKSIIKNFLLKRTDEHDKALDILSLLSQKQYKDLFSEEKIIETLDIIESFAKGITFEDDDITKTLKVDDLNMQAVSFFILMFMFGGELNISEQKFLALSKSLTVFNTELFDPNKILEAFIKKDTDYIYHLIDEIIVKGNARIKEINNMLFDNKTFEFNGQTYGYSITTNNSENGLLKDGKILIYFTPKEINYLLDNLDPKKSKRIKRKAAILTEHISQNPDVFILMQKINVLKKEDVSIKSIKKLLKAPIQRALAVTIFILNVSKMFKDVLKTSPFKNSTSINVIYYDNIDMINPSKDFISVYVTETDLHETSFELTEYTINGRTLRITFDTKNNFITAYCPQASKQEIIEMTAKYIKTTISSQNNNINLKNIVVDSNILPDMISYNLSQDNEGFTCISSTFMELGLTFIEDLLKLDDIESVMFSKQIYDYIGDIPFKQLSKILQDKSLGDNQIIIDSNVLLREMTPNQMLLKAFLKTTQLKVVIKVSSQEEMDKINNIYELTDFMLETKKDNTIRREIIEYSPSEGVTQKAPVSYIELTDLTNIEDKLENIPSHQAIVISVNTDSAKNINISDNMVLSSLKITLTRILKSKTISKKTAEDMGKKLAKQINIGDEEKEQLADRYNEIKKPLTYDALMKLIKDYPNVFTSEITTYMEKLFEQDSEEITPAITAFIDVLLNDILYNDNIETLEVTIKLDDIKYYKNILSAA
ncbi:MAG: hypothetical protein IKN42_04255 [Elusimicrobia bacterium]|nr:hypothetical protein [Elusimicrobiota bacterium]